MASQRNCGSEPVAGVARPKVNRHRPPAAKVAAEPAASSSSRKTRSAVISRPDDKDNSGPISKCAVHNDSAAALNVKTGPLPRHRLSPNQLEKKDGVIDQLRPSDKEKGTNIGLDTDRKTGIASTIDRRIGQQETKVVSSREDNEELPTSPTNTWKKEMGNVLGAPTVKNAIQKPALRSVGNVKNTIFDALSPNKDSTIRSDIDRSKIDKISQLKAHNRELDIGDELEQENARTRARLMSALPHYRILNLMPNQIEQRLLSDPRRCTSSVRDRAPPNDRCKNRIGLKADILEVPHLLKKLSKIEVSVQTWPLIHAGLTRIAELSLCNRVHANPAKNILRTLDIQIRGWSSDLEHSYDMDRAIMFLKQTIGKVDSDSGIIDRLESHLEERFKRGELPILPPKITYDQTKSVQKVSAVPTFSPYKPHTEYLQKIMDGDRHQALSKILNKPLIEKELDAKYMYIYWFKDKPDIIKIGVSRDVSRRLRSWEENCGHKSCEHASDERLKYPIKHAFRVETLVHAALKDVRRQIRNCEGCGKLHIEWFEIDVQSALSVIKCFADFMDEEPYAFDREVGAVCLKSSTKVKKRCAEVLTTIDQVLPAYIEKPEQTKELRKAPSQGQTQEQTTSTEDPCVHPTDVIALKSL